MIIMLVNSNQNKYKSSQQRLQTILADQHFTSAQSLPLRSQLLGELEPPQSVRERHTEQGQLSAFPHLTHAEESFLRVFYTFGPWAACNETFQSEEGALHRRGRASAILLWHCSSPVQESLCKGGWCMEAVTFTQGYSASFRKKPLPIGNKDPQRGETTHECCWEEWRQVIVGTVETRKPHKLGSETQPGMFIWTGVALAVYSDLPSVNVLIWRRVIKIPTSQD